MEDLRSKILQHIRMKGPSLPIQISKQFGTNSIMAGAMLSTLFAQKHLKITNAKIGGSPLYYVVGQEGQLPGLLYPHLKEVHKKAFDLLKQQGVLEDAALEPVNRVALRELPDFAKKLTVYTGQIFWKWHLIADSDAEEKIKELVGFEEEQKTEQPAEEKIEQPIIESVLVVSETNPEPISEDVPAQAFPVEPVRPLGESEQKSLAPEPIAEPQKAKKKREARPKAQKTSQKSSKEKRIKKEEQDDVDESFALVDRYFSGRDVEVLEGSLVKKNQEYEFLVRIPSKIGKVKFFVKYRNKKSISEGDLSLAQIIAVGKRLPLLFLTNGNVTAKARQYAESNGIVVEQVS